MVQSSGIGSGRGLSRALDWSPTTKTAWCISRIPAKLNGRLMFGLPQQIPKMTSARSSLSKPKATFAPQNPCQLLNQMLLGRPLWSMLGRQCGEENAIVLRILPWQHGPVRDGLFTAITVRQIDV